MIENNRDTAKTTTMMAKIKKAFHMTSNPLGHSGLAVSTVRIIIKGCYHGNTLGIFVTSFP